MNNRKRTQSRRRRELIASYVFQRRELSRAYQEEDYRYAGMISACLAQFVNKHRWIEKEVNNGK